MEQTEAEKSDAQPETQWSSEEEDEDDDDDEGFVGLTADQSDKGQGDGGEEEDDQDDEDDEEETAAPADAAPTMHPFSRVLSLCGTTKYISKWQTAHRRGAHAHRLTDSPGRTALLTQHELDWKTGVSLPVVCMIEAEALHILEDVERGYKSKLGASHPLTKEVRQRIVKLRSQLAAKTGDRQTRREGWLETVWRWGAALAAMLGLSGASAGGGGHALPTTERLTGTEEPQ